MEGAAFLDGYSQRVKVRADTQGSLAMICIHQGNPDDVSVQEWKGTRNLLCDCHNKQSLRIHIDIVNMATKVSVRGNQESIHGQQSHRY